MTAAIYAYQTGIGPFGAVIVAFVVGGFTFVLGQYAFSTSRSRIVRFFIGLLFAVPAARAGYDVSLTLSQISIPSESWRAAIAVIGGTIVGCMALARLSILNEPAPGGGIAPDPV